MRRVSTDKAKEFYDNAVNIWRSYNEYTVYPLDSALTINNLGILYQETGNYQEAEKYLNDSLKTRQKLVGENHPHIAQSMTNLGNLYHEMGDYKQS